MSPDESVDLLGVIEDANKVLRTAKRGNNSIRGNNAYAKKFVEAHAKARKAIALLYQKIDGSNNVAKTTLDNISNNSEIFFNPETSESLRQEAEKNIHKLYMTELQLELQKKKKTIEITNDLFPFEIVENTKPYIEKIAMQALGSYDCGWYDASAVMIRRLLETLIIECFEIKSAAPKIKNGEGNFLYLEGLITKLLDEDVKLWNLSRNSKKILPRLKQIGDQSAHSRFFTARQDDIDKLKNDLRIVIEELVHISEIKKN